jgi:hypothetical protein
LLYGSKELSNFKFWNYYGANITDSVPTKKPIRANLPKSRFLRGWRHVRNDKMKWDAVESHPFDCARGRLSREGGEKWGTQPGRKPDEILFMRFYCG